MQLVPVMGILLELCVKSHNHQQRTQLHTAAFIQPQESSVEGYWTRNLS